LAFGKLAQLERTVGDANQARHLEAERAHHVLDLTVLAFAEADGEPGVGALLAVECRLDCPVEHAVNGNAVLEAFERLRLDLAVDAHAVAAQPAGRRQLEHAGETAIVGEQDQALGVNVEAADSDETRQAFRQHIEDGLAAFRIAAGRHHAGRLVEQEQARALDRRDFLAVEFDLVGRLHVDRGRGQHLAIHLDAAVDDQALGIATRGNARARKALGDTLAAIGRGWGICIVAPEIVTLERTRLIAATASGRTLVAVAPLEARTLASRACHLFLALALAGARLSRRAAVLAGKGTLGAILALERLLVAVTPTGKRLLGATPLSACAGGFVFVINHGGNRL